MKKIIVLSLAFVLTLCIGFGASLFNNVGTIPMQVSADTIFDNLDSPVTYIDIDGAPRKVYYHGKVGENYIKSTDAGFYIDTEEGTLTGTKEITELSQTGLTGYRFSHFEILKNDQMVILEEGTILDASCLDSIFDVHIVGIYIKICSVTINIPSDYKTMGTYNLYTETTTEEGVSTELVTPESGNTFIFDAGTMITIEAVAFDFHKFTGFKQNYKSELTDDYNILKVNVQINREFSLYFDTDSVVLQMNIKSGSIEISAEQVKLGDEIRIYAKIGKMYEVKDFKVNGISVNHKDYVGDVKYSNNIATVTITEDWLAGYQDILEVEVTTQLNEVAVIVTSSAIVVILVMIALLTLLFVMGRKTKQITRDILKVQHAQNYKMKTGDFISGVRSGKITGEVTSKDVKAEIKQTSKDIKIESKKASAKAKKPETIQPGE